MKKINLYIIFRLTFLSFLFIVNNNILYAQCLQNINWTTWNSFSSNSASGSILYNGELINVTMDANYSFSSTPSIFNYAAFSQFYNPPPNVRVPQTTWVIGQGGKTTMCFSRQVENPVLLISSQGNPGQAVSLKFSRPYILVYDGGGNTFSNDSTIIGREGYSIIKFPGKFDCVSIFSNDYESYTNITWGLNPPLFPITVTKTDSSCTEVSFHADGGIKYLWSGGLYPDSLNNVFTKSGVYFLTVTDETGCIVNTSVSVNIDEPQKVSLSSGNPNQDVCLNKDISPIEFKYDKSASSIDVTGLPLGVGFTFSNGILLIGGKPLVTALIPFEYLIKVNSSCGISTFKGTINVRPTPKLILSKGTRTQDVCINSSIVPLEYIVDENFLKIEVNGLPSGINYSYANGKLLITGSPFLSNLLPYKFTVIVSYDCEIITSNGEIKVNLIPQLSLTKGSSNQEICIYKQITPIEYTYDNSIISILVTGLPAGITFSSMNGLLRITGTPTISSDKSFEYSVSMNTSCGIVLSKGNITVNPLPVVNAGPDLKVESGSLFKLNGESNISIKTINWIPEIGLDNPRILNPAAKLFNSVEYTLTITSQDNCLASDNVKVEVLGPLQPPDIFSPNGDGINDKWIIRNIESYKNIEVKIFNRYGTLLFEKKGYDSSSSWDGTYNNQNLPVGSYFYVLKTEGNNILKGVVSILR